MKITIPFLASLCLITACTHPVTDKIQVTGQATMKVVPDMVELSLKSFNVRPAMKDAVIETQAAINQILTYSPGGERTSSIQSDGNDYDLNLYNKSFGGRRRKI
jgi:hypothetical protein